MIGRPYLWQCEAERCYRQRDRRGRWHAHGRDLGPDDPGPGNRYHPECAAQGRLDWAATVAGVRDGLRSAGLTVLPDGEIVRLDDPRAPREIVQ